MNMEPGVINDTYELLLPDFRVSFHADRPNWEKGRLESCADLMRLGMVVYDIGAECGDFTSLYKTWVGRAGDVIPVEPASHQWEFIRSTWHANGFTEPPEFSFVGLIADRNVGERPFFAKGWPDESNSRGIPDGGFVHLTHSPHVACTTVDEMSSYKPPGAIVIDVEGAEWNVLNGARQTLETHRPLVWVSVHDVSDDPDWKGSLEGWYNKTVVDIHNLMVQCGYGYEELPSHGEAERFFLYRPT